MNLDEFEIKMMKAIENLEERYINIRAGRANPSMLNGVMVDFYGTPTPISSIANITVPEAIIAQMFSKCKHLFEFFQKIFLFCDFCSKKCFGTGFLPEKETEFCFLSSL